MKKNIFLTGATGFLGSHILDVLKTDKNIAKINAPTRNLNNSKKNINLNNPVNINFIPINWQSEESIFDALEDCEYVIHSAGSINPKKKEDYYINNLLLTESLLNICKQKKIKQFIFISTQWVMGPNKNLNKIFTELDPPIPIGHYSKSKLLTEKLVLTYQSYFHVIIIRPSVIYGPKDIKIWEFFLKILLKKRLNFQIGIGKNQKHLNLIYVEDLASLIHHCLNNAKINSGEIFFITDGNHYKWSDLVKKVAEILKINFYITIPIPKLLIPLFGMIISKSFKKKDISISKDQFIEYSYSYLCSNEKAISIIPIKITPLKIGIKKTVEYFLKKY